MKNLRVYPSTLCGSLALAGLAAGVLVSGCHPQSTHAKEITDVREAPRSATQPATTAERFGWDSSQMQTAASSENAGPRMNQAAPSAHAEAALPELKWETPTGWTELAASQFRQINLKIPGGGECYVTLLPGEAGGALSNINRWRAQMSLEPIGEAELADLPMLPVLGEQALLVVMEGTFKGMGGQPRKDYGLLGMLVMKQGNAIFAKCTGPAAVIQKEKVNFEAFCKSLTATEGSTNAKAATGLPASDQAALMAAHPGMSTETLARALQSGVPAAAGTTDSGGAADWHWTVPAGWEAGKGDPMRLATFRAAGTECSVLVLPGQAGGLEANLNRWRSQMGQPALGKDEIAKLPKIKLGGQNAPLIEIPGTYRGMGGTPIENALMLGSTAMLDGQAVFIKLTGPRAAAEAQRDAFIAFCESFHGAKH